MAQTSAVDLPVARVRGVGTLVLCTFFVSGACGLVHEVAWTRLLRHVMGNTTFSITTVLCAFMGGLALGSYLGGRFIDRRKDSLRIFALLEGTIAVYCFMLPWLIQGTEPIYRFIYQHTHTSFYVFSLIRFLFSMLLLLIPATFMGATLPVLTRFFTQSPERIGWSVGTLYAINTFGAVLGAWSSGFLLIPGLGVTRTIYFASLFNLLVCGIAYFLYLRTREWHQEAAADQDRDRKPRETKRRKKVKDDPTTDQRLRYGRGALFGLLIGYGFSGFAALVYEIAWARAISLLIGSTVYAFSMMLTAFVLGLAVGSMICARFADRVRDPMRAMALIQGGIGLSALVVVPVIGSLPLVVTGMISRFLGSFWLLQLAEFSMILLVMLVPTTLMGAAFPLANSLFNQESTRVGRSVGTVYGCNTIGTIVGSFLGGFVLIPFLGIQNTIFTAVAINIAVSIGFVTMTHSLAPAKKGLVAVGVALVAGGCMAAIPEWNASLMSFGPYHEAVRISKSTAQSRRALENLAQKSKVLYHKEGLTTTVTVKEVAEGVLALYINGKPDASSLSDLPSQEMVAHLPLLMHPNPRNALVIGLASGISLGSAALHPLETIDCVEISPAMIEAARYFDEFNYQVLDDPRVNIIIEDGRNYLSLTDKEYDVILSQPSNPYFAGIADLFTREFFQLCRQRLSDRGVMCTWVQAYNIDHMSFRSIVRTFKTVFPNMTFWRAGKSDCLLVGSKGDLSIDYESFAQRIHEAKITADLHRIEIWTIPDLLAQVVMGPEGVERFAGDATIHTDDNALVEFTAPRALTRNVYDWNLVEAIELSREPDLSFLTAAENNSEKLAKLKKEATRFIQARGHVFQANIDLHHGRQQEATEEIRRAAELNPADLMLKEFNAADHKKAYYLSKEGKDSQAIALYRTMVARVPGDERAHYNLATLLKKRGEYQTALHHYREAASLKPNYIYAHYNVGEMAERLGLLDVAVKEYRQALALEPDMIPALNNLSRILAAHPDPARQDPVEATRLAEKACQLTDYKDPFLLYTLSGAYASAGQFGDAKATAQRGLKLAQDSGNQKMVQWLRQRLQRNESLATDQSQNSDNPDLPPTK
jgi:spermidine synthase